MPTQRGDRKGRAAGGGSSRPRDGADKEGNPTEEPVWKPVPWPPPDGPTPDARSTQTESAILEQTRYSDPNDDARLDAPPTQKSSGRLGIGKNLYAEPTAMQRLQFRAKLRLDRGRDQLQAALEREAERGAVLLWTPVLLAIGIVLYFQLSREPIFLVFGGVAVLAFWLNRRLAKQVEWDGSTFGSARWLTWCVAVVSMGATLAQSHVVRLSTPSLGAPVTERISGTVLRAEHRANG
ncbi:MAG: hypothetical protein AAGM04_09455, partial [Pseudomonadota bacterium]